MTRGFIMALLLGVATVLGTDASAQRIKLPVPMKQLQQVVRADSCDPVAHYNVALGYWSEKKYDEAESSLRTAVELEPRFALAYLALAVLPFARNDKLWNQVIEGLAPVEWRDRIAESDRMYRMAFMLNPLVELRILGAVEPKRSVLWEMDPELAALYNNWLRGFDDFRDGDYAGAFFRLDRLASELTIGKKSANTKRLPEGLLWYRGLAAAQVSKYPEAIRDLRELLVRVERDERRLTYLPLEADDYRYALAAVYRRAGDFDQAAELYGEIAGRDAGSFVSHVALGDMHQQQGDRVRALAERERAVAANPEDLTSHIELAVALSQTGRNPDAERVLREVTSAHPRSFRAWYLQAILQQADGRAEDARTSLNMFLQTAPSRFPEEIADAKRRLAALQS